MMKTADVKNWIVERNGSWDMYTYKPDTERYVIHHMMTGNLAIHFYDEERIAAFGSIKEALSHAETIHQAHAETVHQETLF